MSPRLLDMTSFKGCPYWPHVQARALQLERSMAFKDKQIGALTQEMRMLQARYAEPGHSSVTEGCDGLEQHLRCLGGPRLMYVIPAHEIALAAGALGGEGQNANPACSERGQRTAVGSGVRFRGAMLKYSPRRCGAA